MTRTRAPFWSAPRPAPVLAGAVLGTQAIATVIAVYGVLMTPLGWDWAGLVWAYALVGFLVEDRVKLATHRWLDTGSRPVARLALRFGPETTRPPAGSATSWLLRRRL